MSLGSIRPRLLLYLFFLSSLWFSCCNVHWSFCRNQVAKHTCDTSKNLEAGQGQQVYEMHR
jgi:hypothetical protein